MASTTTDRLAGVTAGLASKAPVRAATTANITLSGEQTIDGVAVVADDRVLVKNQTDGIENGVYDAKSGAWVRALDFDGARDVVSGTLVVVASGTVWRISTADPITIGTTSIAFVLVTLESATAFMLTLLDDIDAATARATLMIDDAGTPRTKLNANEVALTLQQLLDARVVNVLDFIAQSLHADIRDHTSTTDVSTEINNAMSDISSLWGGGVLVFPAGKYIMGAATLAPPSNVSMVGEGKRSLLSLADSSDVDVITLADKTDITIKDLAIDGNRTNQTSSVGIFGNAPAATTARILIHSVWIDDTRNQGIFFKDTQEIAVVNCRLNNIGSHGILFGDDTDVCADMYVAGCKVFNWGLHVASRQGIEVWGDRSIITGNLCTGDGSNSHTAISHGKGNYGIINNNILKNANNYGVEVAVNSNFITVDGNIITNVNAHGIAIVGNTGGEPARVIVSDNSVDTALADGIHVSNGPGSGTLLDITVSGNVVKSAGAGVGDYGISVQDTIHVCITGNVVRLSQDAGIFVATSDNVIIGHNEVTSNNQDGGGSTAGIRIGNTAGEVDMIIQGNGTSGLSVANAVDVNTNNKTDW